MPKFKLKRISYDPNKFEKKNKLLSRIHSKLQNLSRQTLEFVATVRPEKFQFMEKGQNRNFNYEIVITVKNP